MEKLLLCTTEKVRHNQKRKTYDQSPNLTISFFKFIEQGELVRLTYEKTYNYVLIIARKKREKNKNK